MNISSSNYYSVSASSSNGFSGLVSGMDTEGMVKEMLSGAQAKIDKNKQAQQQIEWKQEIYRDIVSTINNFQSSYFDTSYDAKAENNLASKSFFNSMKSDVTSGSAVKVISSNSSALTGEMSIKVDQLATSAKLESSVKVSGEQKIVGAEFTMDDISNAISDGISFDLTLDGVSKSITIDSDNLAAMTGDELKKTMEAEVKKAFGTYIDVTMNETPASGDDPAKYSFDFSINIMDGGVPEAGHELSITGDGASDIGIEPGTSTLVSGMTKLSNISGVTVPEEGCKFTINDTEIALDKDAAVSTLLNTINSSDAGVKITYSSMTDTFSMESTLTGEQYGIEISEQEGNVLSHIFGQDFSNDATTPTKIGTSTDAGGDVIGTAGTDAEVEINGISTSRSSNTFTIEGITMTATEVTEAGADATVIGTVRDDDKIVNAIKSFVDDYNKMVKMLDDYVKEDAEYRDYKPLTSAQEDEMSEKQIELWEKKAKIGLVRSDPDINTFLDSVRSAAYATPKSAGIGLYSIGILTKAWDKTGTLEIDEAQLRSALASDPDAVIDLFTDADEGVATQLNDACDYAAKVSVASPGLLVQKAGANNWATGDTNNDLYFELSSLKDRLEDLQDTYDKEKERYWHQFTTMETVLSQYTAQSNMLAQQFLSY